MLHSITIPREVLGTDVRVDYYNSPTTKGPVILSGSVEYDHEAMREDVVNYILDRRSEDMRVELLDELETAVDNYIERMVDERVWK
jgi:hypothetical protein